MTLYTKRKIVSFTLLGLVMMPGYSAVGTPPPAGSRNDLYDKTADGEKQIADALIRAKRDNKRVLIQFGANWCGWCHKLHDLFENNRKVAKTLQYEYELVLIDVDTVDGKQHNASVDRRFGDPTKLGLPVLVVLDAEGKPLVTQETGALEVGDRHDPAKVLAFLDQWKPAPQSAKEVLSNALKQAERNSKKVFVYFSAPWCRWCHRWDEYLRRPDVAKVFGEAFVTVKIDIERMAQGKETQLKICETDQGGIPFFVVVQPDGSKVADSVGPEGNVVFPVDPNEVAHFMKVLEQTTMLTKE